MLKKCFCGAAFLLLSVCPHLWADDFRSWTPTPAMGWNSYDCFGLCVDEKQVLGNAEYMAKNLLPYGWEYIVLDARWFQANNYPGYSYVDNDTIELHREYSIDDYGRLVPPAEKFPTAKDGRGFKTLVDRLHAMGLKFGLHLMRGVPKKSVELKRPIFGLPDVTLDKIVIKKNACEWSNDNYQLNVKARGAQEFYNSIMALFASWGVDFVKVDDISHPYCREEVEMYRKAIDLCGRKIVLSLSPGECPLTEATHVSTNANSWRIVGDLWDNWGELKYLMQVAPRWASFIGNGTWPDCDMIPLGRLCVSQHPGAGPERQSRLKPSEQKMLMELFCMARSPLMFGGDMTQMDPQTLALLTNRELLSLHRESCGNRVVDIDNNHVIWMAENAKTGDTYVAMFNLSDKAQTLALDLRKQAKRGRYVMTELWTGRRTAGVAGVVSRTIDAHASFVFRLK